MPFIIVGTIAVGVILLLWGLRIGVKQYIQHSAQQAKIVEYDPLLADLEQGKPAIIYFTSPGCGPCRTTQKPIIQQLEKDEGAKIQILTINIEEKLDDAIRWGVMKVPRTFVLDRNLRTYASNMSIATLATLKQQLQEAEEMANTPIQAIKFVN